MREKFHHHEEFGRGERRGRGEQGERTHHREEFERGGRGEQGERRHHHEEFEHRGPRGRGPRYASWRTLEEEDGPRRNHRHERIERGMLRYLLLDALQQGPKHGYEIIKWLEERTYGRYAPSAGTVYPTLQLLEDQGFLQAERTEEKSVYRLTEVGEKELQAHADFTQEFWERFGHPEPPVATRLAGEFVYEELQDLQRTVEKGVRTLMQQADQESLGPLRRILERSKNEIRDLLVRGSAVPPIGPGTHHNAPVGARELEEVVARVFAGEDEALRQTRVRTKEQGLPSIEISALQGKLLQVLAAACQARKILEIGALAGYSGIWLARALPADGRLITLEIDERHAEVVRESFRQAQVDERAEVRVGPALETLPQLEAEGPFDLIFIDANKDGYPQYLEWALKLARPGSIIVADNCIQGGEGLKLEDETNTRGAGIRTYNREASSNPALCSIALPINTGMTISVVWGDGTEQK